MTLPFETHKTILTGLGYCVCEELRNGDSGLIWFILIEPNRHRSLPFGYDTEQAAWESRTIDANFCEAEILLEMKKRGYTFSCREHFDGIYRATFTKRTSETDVLSFEGVDASLRAAIALAFYNYLKGQK